MDKVDQTTPPVIILVRPQLGENIGAAARAMLNCGLFDLRLVAPRDGWPNEAAFPMAAGAKSIIENVTVFDTVVEATTDIIFLAATSARRRDLAIRSVDPRSAAKLIAAQTGTRADGLAEKKDKTAFLFGPEASGLDNDEVVLADILVTASLNPVYPSLNLAQGVLLMAWEWRMAVINETKHRQVSQNVIAGQDERATVFERNYFFNRLENELDDGQFFTSPDMIASVKRNIRALFVRASPSKQEVRTLHGVLQALTRKRKP